MERPIMANGLNSHLGNGEDGVRQTDRINPFRNPSGCSGSVTLNLGEQDLAKLMGIFVEPSTRRLIVHFRRTWLQRLFTRPWHPLKRYVRITFREAELTSVVEMETGTKLHYSAPAGLVERHFTNQLT